MGNYQVSVLGFGDNVADMYEHTRIMYPGGNCVNFAVYARKFGAERSAYMGSFGNDEKAAHVQRALADIGIETEYCRQLIGENGWCRVTLRDGDRVFLGCNKGGIRGRTPFILEEKELNCIREFDLVHSGNYSFTEEELPKLHKAGVRVSFDFSDDSTEAYYRRIVPYIDYAFCSFDGTEEEAKAHLRFITGLGAKLACASRGDQGCLVFDGVRFYIQPAHKIEHAIDTMGAGDSLLTSFLVGYLHRIKQGQPEEQAITEALKEAVVFAADVCETEGAFGYGTAY